MVVDLGLLFKIVYLRPLKSNGEVAQMVRAQDS
jgi:hypothetical protein